jgi:hypothetical protein
MMDTIPTPDFLTFRNVQITEDHSLPFPSKSLKACFTCLLSEYDKAQSLLGNGQQYTQIIPEDGYSYVFTWHADSVTTQEDKILLIGRGGTVKRLG